jgi:hypothetical protein
MSIPLHPLTKPQLDQLTSLIEPPGVASAQELERRAQELLNEWLKFHFSGNPFATPITNGETMDTSLTHCDILFDHASPPTPAPRPILHTILTDRRDDDGVPDGTGRIVHTGEWTWNTLIRVAPQMPVNPVDASSASTDARHAAAQVCRRVADQCAWLLRSAHVQSLAFKGITHVRVLNGPRLVQSGTWLTRQIVWSSKLRFSMFSNSP